MLFRFLANCLLTDEQTQFIMLVNKQAAGNGGGVSVTGAVIRALVVSSTRSPVNIAEVACNGGGEGTVCLILLQG